MAKCTIVVLGSLLLSGVAWGGPPVVIDFETLRVDSNTLTFSHGTWYQEDGFLLTVSHPLGQATDFRTTGTLSPLFAGSTALFAGRSISEIRLERVEGGTLISIRSIS